MDGSAVGRGCTALMIHVIYVERHFKRYFVAALPGAALWKQAAGAAGAAARAAGDGAAGDGAAGCSKRP